MGGFRGTNTIVESYINIPCLKSSEIKNVIEKKINLLQAPGEARALLKFFDGSLGVPIEEQDYGGGCLIYDPDVPDNPYHNVWVITNI